MIPMTDTTATMARRRWTLIAVVVALAIACAIAALQISQSDGPVERALSLLERESSFDSSEEAVQHFAVVYQDLVDATSDLPKDCDVKAGKGRCLALNQAAAWSLSFSPASGQCTQPAIQTGRVALLQYVQRSAALDEAAAEPPVLPPIPSC